MKLLIVSNGGQCIHLDVLMDVNELYDHFITRINLPEIVLSDIAINTERNIRALFSSENDSAFHYFDIDNLKLLKKVSWNPNQQSLTNFQHIFLTIFLLEAITGLTFQPLGEKIATIDFKGNFAINDINTSNLLVSMQLLPYDTKRIKYQFMSSLIVIKFLKTNADGIQTNKFH